MDEIVVLHLRQHVGMGLRIKPARVEREMLRDRQRTLRRAAFGGDLGRLDVKFRQGSGEDRSALLREGSAPGNNDQTQSTDESSESPDHGSAP